MDSLSTSREPSLPEARSLKIAERLIAQEKILEAKLTEPLSDLDASQKIDLVVKKLDGNDIFIQIKGPSLEEYELFDLMQKNGLIAKNVKYLAVFLEDESDEDFERRLLDLITTEQSFSPSRESRLWKRLVPKERFALDKVIQAAQELVFEKRFTGYDSFCINTANGIPREGVRLYRESKKTVSIVVGESSYQMWSGKARYFLFLLQQGILGFHKLIISCRSTDIEAIKAMLLYLGDGPGKVAMATEHVGPGGIFSSVVNELSFFKFNNRINGYTYVSADWNEILLDLEIPGGNIQIRVQITPYLSTVTTDFVFVVPENWNKLNIREYFGEWLSKILGTTRP